MKLSKGNGNDVVITLWD